MLGTIGADTLRRGVVAARGQRGIGWHSLNTDSVGVHGQSCYHATLKCESHLEQLSHIVSVFP